MAFNSNEIKVGAVVVASVVILGLFLVAIFGVSVGKETNEYRVNLDYVGGITKGSLVKYRGLNVGQVREIVLPSDEQPQLGLILDVKADTPVRTNSEAFITSIGIMSEQHVEISSGTQNADLLSPGSTIASKEVLSFARMSESMGNLTGQIETLIASINELVNEENRTRIASIMENVDAVVSDGREPITEAVAKLQEMTEQMTLASRNIAAMTDTSQLNSGRLINNLEATTANAQRLIEQMNSTLENMQGTVAINNRNIYETMENFERVSQNFEEFSRMIKEQPWLLVRKSAPPERKIK